MDIIYLIIGLVLGAFIVFIIFRSMNRKLGTELEANKLLAVEKQEALTALEIEKQVLAERIRNQEENKTLLCASLENLATKIFEDKEKKSQEQIKLVLSPLNRDIETFRKKVEEMNQGTHERMIMLNTRITELSKLNKEITEETANLTRALKGDQKKQGNWGEVVLQRLLEMSGLKKGEEFETQSSFTEEGKRLQPDVIIKLPENKQLIIDSKVSLISYERAVNAQNDEDHEKYLKDFVISVKAHIDSLNKKYYQGLKELNSPDYIFMFLAVEGSYMMAMSNGLELYEYAVNKKVILVGPTNLLASLKTVALIWQQENQTRNALDIAEKSGAMYDKFVGFYEDLKKVGDQLERTRTSYDDAMNKLKDGRGNLVNRAQDIKKLGAKAKKDLKE